MKDDKRMTRKAGVTIIELAIVMIVIGVLLGIVFKAQDLMNNARAKKVVRWCRQWETAQWSYYYRYERLAGDTDGNGVIADEAPPTSPLQELIDAGIIEGAQKSINMGGYTFYIKMGHDTVGGEERNAIVICPSVICGRSIMENEIVFMEVVDNILDDGVDAGVGDVRGIISITLAAGNEAVTHVTEESSSSSDWSTSYKGLVYYFEKSS